MEVALFHPNGGYYVRRPTGATHPDYFTSPQAHPAFGALIAIQLWLMWDSLERPHPFHVIEMGAGDGLLAREVVEYAPSLPDSFSIALSYVALDRSSLRAAPHDRPALYQSISTARVPVKGVVGCLLSNELVDSFPVHRFEIQRGQVKEVFLSLRDDRLVEVIAEPSTPLLARRVGSLAPTLPEGYRGEVNPGIAAWIAEVASALEKGFVITIDYGYEGADVYPPGRPEGTVETHYRHTREGSPYERIGMQDITAHVDFLSVASDGEAVGLKPVGLCTQAQFLAGLGFGDWLSRLRAEKLAQSQRDANSMAMRQLVRPDGLGDFKVLVQEKGTGITELGQLLPARATRDEADAWAADLPIPLLGPEQIRLMEGRYPHLGWQPEGYFS
jgi:SAM-dependent MidA family methyltransferase